jgi:hypothetical protein
MIVTENNNARMYSMKTGGLVGPIKRTFGDFDDQRCIRECNGFEISSILDGENMSVGISKWASVNRLEWEHQHQ